jgi:hypothetical protein
VGRLVRIGIATWLIPALVVTDMYQIGVDQKRLKSVSQLVVVEPSTRAGYPYCRAAFSQMVIRPVGTYPRAGDHVRFVPPVWLTTLRMSPLANLAT